MPTNGNGSSDDLETHEVQLTTAMLETLAQWELRHPHKLPDPALETGNVKAFQRFPDGSKAVFVDREGKEVRVSRVRVPNRHYFISIAEGPSIQPAEIIGRREGKPRSEYFIWKGRWNVTPSVKKVKPEKALKKMRNGNGAPTGVLRTSRRLDQPKELKDPNSRIVKLRSPILIGYNPDTTNSKSTDVILVNTFVESEKSIARRRNVMTSPSLEYGKIKSEKEDEEAQKSHQTLSESETMQKPIPQGIVISEDFIYSHTTLHILGPKASRSRSLAQLKSIEGLFRLARVVQVENWGSRPDVPEILQLQPRKKGERVKTYERRAQEIAEDCKLFLIKDDEPSFEALLKLAREQSAFNNQDTRNCEDCDLDAIIMDHS